MIAAPRSEQEVADLVAAARAGKSRLAVEGGGTRAGLVAPRGAGAALTTRELAGIIHYDPAEMTIAAKAGTPVAEIEAALAAHGQMLPFEPVDPRALYGTNGAPTLGGLVAAGFSGPRRVQAGGLRDALLGVRFVNGYGEIIKSGGRVVKNVTGLDLARLQVGAQGRFGVLTQMTFKLLPRPAARATLALDGLDEARAIEALSAALATPFEISGAAHDPRRGLTLLRLENNAESVAYRLDALTRRLAPFAAARRLDEDEADALWRDLRDLRPFAGAQTSVWRVATAPSRAAALVATLRAVAPIEALYDWGGGLVHLSGEGDDGAIATALRGALGGAGHARLLRGPGATLAPPSDPAAALKARLANAFDPDGVFAPVRA